MICSLLKQATRGRVFSLPVILSLCTHSLMILKGSVVEQKECGLSKESDLDQNHGFAAFQFLPPFFPSFLSFFASSLCLLSLSFLPSFHQFIHQTLIELLCWSVPSAEDTVVTKADTQSLL